FGEAQFRRDLDDRRDLRRLGDINVTGHSHRTLLLWMDGTGGKRQMSCLPRSTDAHFSPSQPECECKVSSSECDESIVVHGYTKLAIDSAILGKCLSRLLGRLELRKQSRSALQSVIYSVCARNLVMVGGAK